MTVTTLAVGPIQKMRAQARDPVAYRLPVGEQEVAMNPLLDARLRLEYTGSITCIHCARATRKSFNQGYCYRCFTSLARCDQCVIKPELCHYHAGTCREPVWGEAHCMIPHTVYLANSSGLKVGITRGLDPTTRWIDQGAAQGLAIRTVPTRLDAGRVEVALKRFASDRTDWRKMLRGEPPSLDLNAERDRLLATLEASAPGKTLAGEAPCEPASLALSYPVLEHPSKVVSFNLDKQPLVDGVLRGIKGQYLIFDTGVINMRKYAGYHVRLGRHSS